MDSKIIQDYLTLPREKRDFSEGLEIYNRFRGNPNLRRLFALKGPTEYNTEKLEYELRSIMERNGTFLNMAPAPPTPKPRNKEIHDKPTGTLAQELAKLQEERKVLLQEAAHLHSRLDIEQDDEKRREACEIIYYNALRINQIHRILDHAAETNEILPEKPITRPDIPLKKNYATMSEAQLIRERNNIRSSMSKNKNNPKRLAELQAASELINSLLKKFQS